MKCPDLLLYPYTYIKGIPTRYLFMILLGCSLSSTFAQTVGMALTIPDDGISPGTTANHVVVTHQLKLQNTSRATAENVGVLHNIGAAGNYDGALVQIVGNPVLNYAPVGSSFAIRGDYDGNLSPFLLVTGDLDPNDSLMVTIRVEIDKTVLAVDEVLTMQSRLTSDNAGAPFSDSGTDPTTNNATDKLILAVGGDPSGTEDPTPLPNCFDCTLDCPGELSTELGVDCSVSLRTTLSDQISDNHPVCMDLGFYTLEVRTPWGALTDEVITGTGINTQLCFDVTVSHICCVSESCEIEVCVERNTLPVIEGISDTVYCFDPIVEGPLEGTVKYAQIPCQGQMEATLVGDWTVIFPCEEDEEFSKIIYRQYAAVSKDGIRGVGYDTITVRRLPPLSSDNFYCSEKDSLYCGSRSGFGPYMVLEPLDGADCDTLFFIEEDLSPVVFTPECGITVHVNTLEYSGSPCDKLSEVTVDIFQSCYTTVDAGMMCSVAETEGQFSRNSANQIFASCTFWLIDKDTLPPDVTCDLSGYEDVDLIDGIPTAYIDAGANCLNMDMNLPPVWVSDSCNDILIVKAMVDTFGIFLYDFDSTSGLYTSEVSLSLHYRTEPYLVVFEVMDVCNNLSNDTCAVIVRDAEAPTAVTFGDVELSMDSKLDFISSDMMDNNSTDNCEVEHTLVRRADWLTAAVALCDSIIYVDDIGNETSDSLWCVFLEPDPAINPLTSFYAQSIFDLATDGTFCGEILAQAWHYTLCRYATVECLGTIDDLGFRLLYDSLYPGFNVEDLHAIGGGWAESTPVTCDDACTDVTVELLVTDSWCNFTVNWTDVSVFDGVSPTFETEISDIDLSCWAFQFDSAYQVPGITDPLPLIALINMADAGSETALNVLDTVIGTYLKGWRDLGGDIVDEEGSIINPVFTLTDDGICNLEMQDFNFRRYDTDIMDMTDMIEPLEVPVYSSSELVLTNGLMVLNCDNDVVCSQSFDFDLQDCGTGTITRTFTFTKGCPGFLNPTVTTREQVITIGVGCPLTAGYFSPMQDTVIEGCMEVGFDGNAIGSAHPDSVGRPILVEDADCKMIAIAYSDNILSELTSPDCYYIYRTWYFADWCNIDDMAGDDWWMDEAFVSDTARQLIVLRDGQAPTCSIIAPTGNINDEINLSTCGEPFPIEIAYFDTCSVESIEVFIDTLNNVPEFENVLVLGPFTNNGVRDTLELLLDGFGPTTIRVRTRTMDMCLNETICADTFEILCDISIVGGGRRLASSEMEKTRRESAVSDGTNNPAITSDTRTFTQGPMLYQNRPNPFRNSTTIEFYIPEQEQIKLSFFDIQGRLLYVRSGIFSKGNNALTIAKSSLGTSGIIYYQMETSTDLMTRKMLVLP